MLSFLQIKGCHLKLRPLSIPLQSPDGFSDMSLVHIFQACFVRIHDSPKIYFFKNGITLYISFCSLLFLLNIAFLRSILIIRYQPNIFLSTTLAVFFQLCWLSPTVRNMWSSSHLWICKTETKISPSIYPLCAMHSVIFYSFFHTVSQPTKLIYWPTNGLNGLFYFALTK